MDSQTEDVIIMAHVETLGILLSVVHNPNSGYMVDYLAGLGVEQIAPAIVTPVAAKKQNQSFYRYGQYKRLCCNFEKKKSNELEIHLKI